MFTFDVAEADLVAHVSLADASTQDHSTLDKQFPGLHNDLMWLWAMVDTENGKRYQMVRCVGASATFDYTLHECLPDIWTYPRHVRVPGESDLYWGPSVWLDTGDAHTLIPANATMGRKHRITVTLGPTQYVWKDDDVIDLVLTPLPDNVTVIDVPGRPDPVGYTSSGCTVSGSIEGSTIVGGYGGIDRMYCLPGLSCQISKMAHLEHYWFVWAAELADGRWETGNCMLGAGGYATATLRRPGEPPVIASNDEISAKVLWEEKDGASQPYLAQISFGGHTFDFTGTHNAAACAAALGIFWLHGTVQRQGGPKAVRSWSTMEVIQKGLSSDADGARATPRS